MDRFICIHGHFYQPPRENPWLEAVEVQDSAYPFHDWNDRINTECYAPNGASRLLDEHGRIAELVNNYEALSFNFGPTLLWWIEHHDPETYAALIEADKRSRAARGGHGNALAQVYNHMIMPLCSRRDKITQIVWGIRDFHHRFGRAPEGMWLAETAVDSETLELMAELGLKFTVLSPFQAKAVRPLRKPDAHWQDASNGRIDPSQPYRWISPRGLAIDLFFYDAPISQAVAFEGLLNSGDTFANRLMQGFNEGRGRPQLVHIATDGESYGHHHRFGDMALAFAARRMATSGQVKLTNYGEFLARFPPDTEVQIHEASSWSCSHGVERWRSDCGCRIGYREGWTQGWRGPLRAAFDFLRDRVDALYETQAPLLFNDPGLARNAYVDLILDRSPERVRRFFEEQSGRVLEGTERVRALKLLEMQRYRLYMYTSCGWFFDEVSGIEGTTVLRFAGRALQLAEELGDAGLERDFRAKLREVKSNIPEFGDGEGIWDRFVKPAVTSLDRVAAHAAIESLADGAAPDRLYCFRVERREAERQRSGTASFAYGDIEVRSLMTEESVKARYAVLHAGGHDFKAYLSASDGAAPDHAALQRAFGAGVTEAAGVLSEAYSGGEFALRDLFLESRRRVLTSVLDDFFARLDASHRRLVADHMPLIRFFHASDVPLPASLQMALQYTLSRDVAESEGRLADPAVRERLTASKADADHFGLKLDWRPVEDEVRRLAEDGVKAFRSGAQPGSAEQLNALLSWADRMGFRPHLWRAENAFYVYWRSRHAGGEGADQALRDLAVRLRQAVPGA